MNTTNEQNELLESDKPCAYLEDTLSDIRYKYIQNCDAKTNYAMIERGWRRFGHIHFTPECKSCNECKTIRIDTQEFEFSNSHKRIFRKNRDLKIYVQKTTIRIEQLTLFHKYHSFMSEKKDWDSNFIPPKEYQTS